MNELLKKNWFVLVVAVVFTAIAVFFVYDQNKDKLPGKSANGSGVIFSMDNQNWTADDLYDELYPVGGTDAVYMLMQRALLENCITVDDEMKAEATEMADNYLAYFEQYYGNEAEAYIAENLKVIGLDSLYDYCLYNSMLEKLLTDHVTENLDTLYPKFEEEYKPRLISHVLVKMDDPDKPTAEEKDRLAEVQEAWNNHGDMDFASFAQVYSDDSGSAVNGGAVGYSDTRNPSNFVEDFQNAAMELNEGEVSEWVKSEFGYHLILVTSTKREDIVNEISFLEGILDCYPSLESDLLLAKLEEKNVTFASEELENEIKNALKTAAEEEGGEE